jgi:hypothetical protein
MTEAGISYKGVTCEVKTSETEFTVTITEHFADWLTKKELTMGWISVGQKNREWLHEKLDEFINAKVSEQKANEK